MEKQDLSKIESQISIESNIIFIKEEKIFAPESTLWKFLDYSNWIPGEIEIEEEINKDNDWWEGKSIKK